MSIITTTQTFLERLSNRLGKELGDTPADYTADGKTILAEQRESAINRAVGELYDAKLGDGELTVTLAQAFMNKFIDYRYIETYTRTAGMDNTKTWEKRSEDELKIRKIISILINATDPLIQNVTAYPYTDEQYNSAPNNQYSNFYPTTIKPWFYEFTDSFSLEMGVGSDGISDNVIDVGTLKAQCLIAPVYQAFGTTLPDILAPKIWENEIIELAKSIVQGSNQQ